MHVLSPTIPFLHRCMLIFSISDKVDFFNCTVLFSIWHFLDIPGFSVSLPVLWRQRSCIPSLRHWFSQNACNTSQCIFPAVFRPTRSIVSFKSKLKPRTTLIASINIYKLQHYEYRFSLSFSKVNQAHFQCKNVQILQDYVNICANWIKQDKAVE